MEVRQVRAYSFPYEGGLRAPDTFTDIRKVYELENKAGHCGSLCGSQWQGSKEIRGARRDLLQYMDIGGKY